MTLPADLSNDPVVLADDARFKTRDMLAEFEQRRQDLLRALANASARDRASAGDCADIVVMTKRFLETIDDRRQGIARPYRDAVAAIAPIVEQWAEDLIAGMRRVEQLAKAFHDAEKERIREQQEQQRREQEQLRASVAAPPAEHAPVTPAPARPIRGAYGARISTAAELTITVKSVRKVPLEILNSRKVQDAIVAVARDFAKHQDTIPGLEIVRGEKTAIRRY